MRPVDIQMAFSTRERRILQLPPFSAGEHLRMSGTHPATSASAAVWMLVADQGQRFSREGTGGSARVGETVAARAQLRCSGLETAVRVLVLERVWTPDSGGPMILTKPRCSGRSRGRGADDVRPRRGRARPGGG
jgi:hypothetical protein